MPIEKDTPQARGHAPALAGPTLDDHARVCLCEVLDRVLNKGVVVAGDLTISVADIDLIYLGLEVVLTSVETARQALRRAPAGQATGWRIGREEANGTI
jgi:gas vesicle protein GvpA/GvpJ/GvpM family